MSNRLLTCFLDNEYWYGGIVSEGDRFHLQKLMTGHMIYQ